MTYRSKNLIRFNYEDKLSQLSQREGPGNYVTRHLVLIFFTGFVPNEAGEFRIPFMLERITM